MSHWGWREGAALCQSTTARALLEQLTHANVLNLTFPSYPWVGPRHPPLPPAWDAISQAREQRWGSGWASRAPQRLWQPLR